MNDSLVILKDSVKAISHAADSCLAQGIEGIQRTKTITFNSWIAVDILIVTAVLFVLVYKERQFLGFKLREFFSSDNRFFSTQSYSGTNKIGVMVVLVLIMSNAIGLIVTGIASLYPELFDALSSEEDVDTAGLSLTIKVTAMITLFVVVKGLFYAVVNWVFFRVDTNAKWIQAYFFITSAFAFVFFPFALMVLFVGLKQNVLLFLFIILFITYEILVLYKLFANFKPNKYGFLLIFLYFCTVEVMPALFAWKNVH